MDKALRIIVGGQSEEKSIPAFLRRYSNENNRHIHISSVRRTSEGRLKHVDKLCNEIEIVIRYDGLGPVLVLFDADDDICPKEYMDDARVELKARFPDIPIYIVIAKWETETWFIPAMESIFGENSITGEGKPPLDISKLEEIDPKTWISKYLGRKYKETSDQPSFFAKFDYICVAMCKHAKSFRHFLKTIDEIIELYTVEPPE